MKTATVKIEVTNVENVVVTSNGQEYMLVPKKDEIMEVEFEPSYVRVLSDDAQIGFTGGRIYPVIETDFNSGAFFKWRAVNDQNIERWISKENGIKATALEYYTQEAKKRYPDGAKIRCFNEQAHIIDLKKNDRIEFVAKYFVYSGVAVCDTSTDTWATIIPDEVEFIPGRLYEYKDDNNHIVVKCSSEKGQMKGCFAGMVVKEISKSMYHDGYYCNNWAMVDFHPLHRNDNDRR